MLETTPDLVHHIRRPQWGLAILADSSPTKRRYQFEDGRLRSFKEGFFHLFKTVDRPYDETMRITARLEAELDIAMARVTVAEDSKQTRSVVPFPAQVDHFKLTYPEGFNDPAYLSGVRGAGLERTLKRHRDPLLVLGAEQFTEDVLAAIKSSGAYGKIVDSVIAALECTDLARKPDIAPLRDLDEAGRDTFGAAFLAVLEAEQGEVAKRFDELCRTFKAPSAPTWATLTVALAAARPNVHTFIRLSVMREQARWMAPRLKVGSKPDGKTYERLRSMLAMTRRKLEQAELAPNDNFDSVDFMWLTLRPKERKVIEARLKGQDV